MTFQSDRERAYPERFSSHDDNESPFTFSEPLSPFYSMNENEVYYAVLLEKSNPSLSISNYTEYVHPPTLQ
jgi:hypothetical protein